MILSPKLKVCVFFSPRRSHCRASSVFAFQMVVLLGVMVRQRAGEREEGKSKVDGGVE